MEVLLPLATQPGRHALVVTDHSMPGMSGLELATALRTAAPGLPVLMVSGYVTEALQAQAAAAGVREVALKQHLLERLPAAITAALAAAAAATASA